MPQETYSWVSISDEAKAVVVGKQFDVVGPFEFTALQIAITAKQPLVPVSRNYGPVRSDNFPSWGVDAHTGANDMKLMEIVDVSTAVRSTSWGRLKALYR